MNFLAIDFETANHKEHSACAVGLVKVKDDKIIYQNSFLIRPPDEYFHWANIKVHGITWDDVEDAPNFKSIWNEIKVLFSDVEFLAAHNAPFDKRILNGCCSFYKIKPPNLNFNCTCQLSKKLWGLNPAKLSDVCQHFKIPLKHHEALSDATACAKIMIKAYSHKLYYPELAVY